MFSVVGQEFVKESFKRAFENKRISHSYILTGPDGTGKSIFALYMASSLLCRGEEKPCRKCSSCIKIKNNNHPDVKIISGETKSIGVENVRNIIDEIYTKPYEGDRKIVIIKKVDNITVQGQNAILKTLEEPPEDTTIIMLAENLNSILPTIQSRCQILRFARTSGDSIKNFLRKQNYDEDKIKTAVNFSDGIVGRALKFFDENYLKLRLETIDIARRLPKSRPGELMELTDFFVKNKDKINDILDILSIWYRDIIIIKHSRDKELVINADFYELLVEESRLVSYNKLSRIIDTIKETREKLKQNSNYQLTIEVMVLNIQEV
ncbi:DNA polymerase III subunit delta' [Fonticella tunisiensis]|uniref:DNA polymerase III subunit delta' n=1 Tax=Fonticella tunisiensis TaxID=1096341 RepID=A0A4R7K9X7_9CLOT|nr:DNA polymerase III subunit delta' [Fonticella tunisiensis]TDT50572.1 DNA polymerase III delta prime subunit [Fonticella tunisiensis]